MPKTVPIPEGPLQAIEISSRNFERLSQWITAELGIKVGASKTSLVQNRLSRRVRDLGLCSIDDYCEKLFANGLLESERVHLYNAITTNKTDFYREPQHFRLLTESILPDLDRNGYLEPDRKLTIWSAPCSSGEEPYTLAMVLSEYLGAQPAFSFRILATDISTKVLKIARDGIYTAQQAAPIPLPVRRKYLLQSKTSDRSLVRVCAALRRAISFHQLNFMDPDYPVRDMFHIIFCRNVLIYFDRATQEAVINKLTQNLLPGGYLFVGHSESLSGLAVPLISLGASCYRKPD